MAESPGPSQNLSRDASPAPSVQTPRATTPGDQQGGYANLQTPVGYQQPMEQPGYPGHQMGIQGNYDYQSQGPGYPPQHGHSQVFPNQAGETFDGRQSSPHQQVPFGRRTPQTSRPTSLGPQVNQQFIPPYAPQGQGYFQYASPGHSGYQQGQFIQGAYVSPDRSFSQQQLGQEAPGWYGQGPQWETQGTQFQPPFQHQEDPRVQTPVSETEEAPKEEVSRSSEPLRSICVKGVKKNTSKETLELYFESKRKSGGGEIEDLQVKDGSAFITFLEHESAARVCHKEVHQHDNSTWRVSLHDPSKDINSTNVIVVSGYDTPVQKDTLEMYFENNRRSGGGDIEEVRIGKGVVYITYKEAEVAQKVVSREHTLGDKKLTVRLGETAQPRTIAVTGTDPKEHLETIQMYFESKRKSGGGEIEEVKVDRNIIYIRFEMEEVFNRVLKKMPHKVGGHELTVVKADEMISEETSEVPVEEDSVGSAVVEVRGYPKEATEDSITLYFENKRKSGGDEIESFSRNDKKGIIMIRFKSPEVAKRVASKQHTVMGEKLKVKLSVPQVMYKDKILLTGVPDLTSEDSLIHYLEARIQLEVDEFLYGEEEGDILVSFTQPIEDIASLSAAMKKRAFMSTHLQVTEVPKTSSITVRNLSDTVTEDQVTMYFENNRRSGGGDVESVSLNESENIAVVKFMDVSVAEGVCKRDHKLASSKVEVSLHFECLGETGGSREPPCTKIPDPEEFKDVDEYMLKFLVANISAYKKAKNDISQFSGQLDVNLTNKLITVSPTFSKDDKAAKAIIKTWKENVQKATNALLDSIEIEKIDVNSEIWPDVEPKMNALRGQTDMQLFTEEQNWLIIVVGPKEKVKDTGEKVRTIVKEVQTESDRRKNQIREKKSFLPGKLQVLVAKGTMEDISTEFLKVTWDIKSGEVELLGPQEDVKNALVKLLETVTKISERMSTSLSADQLELLMRPNVGLYLEQQQRNQNKTLAGSWKAGKEAVTIYYDQDDSFDEVLDFLTSSLPETTLQLDEENVTLLVSDKFQKKIEELKQDRNDRIVITSQKRRKRIQITAVSEDLNYTKTAVENFIKGHTIYTEKLEYSKPVEKFIVLHCQEKLDRISQDLKQYSVKFTKDPKYGISLKATKDGISQAKMFLQSLAEEIKCHPEVLKKVGISSFIESGDVLQQVEKNSRCVISRTDDTAEQAKGQHRASYDASTQGYDTAFTCTPDIGKTITVVVGNIVALASDVEAVVVEATSDLNPDSGQASAVIGNAGDGVMKEVKRHARTSVLEGEVYGSSSGNLSCRLIIHAVGPTSSTSHAPEVIINAVVIASLEEAQNNSVKSVALPSFNTDTIRRHMSSDVSLNCVMEGIKSFFDENPGSTVTMVYLCIEDIKLCQSVWKQSVNVFGENKVVARKSETKTEKGESPFGMRHRQRHGSSRARDTMDVSGSFSFAENMIAEDVPVAVVEEEEAPPPAAADLPPMAKPRILLVKADMGVEEADVIVSSSNTNLDLNKGMVSRSLLQHAGESIQTECKSKYPNGIQTGEIAVTKGGDMQCVEEIYHCVLPNWDATTGKQTLIDTLNDLLMKVHQAKWKTMAIPALGTGNLGYARDLVAQVMYETVRQFGKDNPDTTINDVLFIVYPGDKESCQVFEAENRKHVEAMGGKVAATQEEIDAEREEAMEAYREDLKENKSRRDNPTPNPEPAASGGWLSGLTKWISRKTSGGTSAVPDFSSISKSATSSEVTLWFYSDDYKNVKTAVDMIYKDMDSNLQTKTLNEQTLKNWTTQQINELMKLEDKYAVTIKHNKNLCRIAVTGLLNNMSEALTHIHKMIREVDKDIQEQEYAEGLKKVVQWYYVEEADDKPVAYDAIPNAKLERAFTKENKMKLTYGGYVFDFKKWVEYPENDSSDQVKIMRKDLLDAASSKPPDTWEDTSDDITVKQVAKGTSEYQDVEQNITSSFAGATLEIIRIDRVQNKTLYQQYQSKRHQMESQSAGANIEKMLWHGTKQENGMNICNYGFNRSYCDKTQSSFGEGVYFTGTAPTAAQDIYAPTDPQGKRYLFQSKVLIGSYTKGQPSFRVAPMKDPKTPTNLYDSVVDDPANPTTFVIFSDTQAYPEYLITIKC